MAKKILIFSTAYIPLVGGAELAIKEITDRSARGEFEFDLITLRFDRRLPKLETIGRVNIYRIGLFTKIDPSMSDLSRHPLKLNKLLFPITACLKASRLHAAKKYDLIWGMMASYSGFAAMFFKSCHPRVRFLLSLQEGDPIEHIKKQVRFVSGLFKRIFSRADQIQAISNYLAGFARSMDYRGDLAVIPNGVDIIKFQAVISPDESVQLKNTSKLKEGDKILITTSRLVKKNAVGDVISALKLLPENVKFLILGIGPEEEALKILASDLGVSDRVRFLGLVGHDEMPKYLRIADIFIRPSLSEGLGSSFLEAMAAGLPVIATPVGGIPDFLFDPAADPEKEPTGLFCKVNDPASIAEKVSLLLRDPGLRSRIAANGRKLVEEKYDWSAVARAMNDIFIKLS